MKSKKPAGKRKVYAPTKVDWKALEIVDPDAAGIDCGSAEHYVAVPPDRSASPRRMAHPPLGPEFRIQLNAILPQQLVKHDPRSRCNVQ